MSTRTQGETQGMRWRTQNYRNYMIVIEEREVYEYTLILDETEGREVTFTQLKAHIRNNANSRDIEWTKAGRWHLAAGGTLEIDLGSWRYCSAVNCRDWGSLAPVWDLTLMGTDARGQPVHRVIEMRLPYADDSLPYTFYLRNRDIKPNGNGSAFI